jgi:hypothetical protein
LESLSTDIDLRFGVGTIAFPHFDFATLVERRIMRIVERHIDECEPSLGIIDIMLSWSEANMAQPFMKDFGWHIQWVARISLLTGRLAQGGSRRERRRNGKVSPIERGVITARLRASLDIRRIE